MKILVSILLFGLLVGGSFLFGLRFLGQKPVQTRQVVSASKSFRQLLVTPERYQFTVKKKDIIGKAFPDWFAVTDKFSDKTAFVYWELDKFGQENEHVFEFVVKKEKKVSWSQIQFIYKKADKSDIYVYMFRADTGQILFQGKTAENMLKVQDEGDSWRITGYAVVPEKALTMQIFLYPALGKKGMGTLRVTEFTLGSPA